MCKSSNQDISHISGNASDEAKRIFSLLTNFLTIGSPGTSGPTFGDSIVRKLVVTEISIEKKAEEPKKLECRFVFETTVEDGLSTCFIK